MDDEELDAEPVVVPLAVKLELLLSVELPKVDIDGEREDVTVAEKLLVLDLVAVADTVLDADPEPISDPVDVLLPVATLDAVKDAEMMSDRV